MAGSRTNPPYKTGSAKRVREHDVHDCAAEVVRVSSAPLQSRQMMGLGLRLVVMGIVICIAIGVGTIAYKKVKSLRYDPLGMTAYQWASIVAGFIVCIYVLLYVVIDSVIVK